MMTKRASLFGGCSRELESVSPNLRLMAELLSTYGFDEVEIFEDATRTTMAREIGRCSANSGQGDVLVVYFAGHGGLVRFEEEVVPGVPIAEKWRYLRTAGGPHTPADFHGLFDIELFELLDAPARHRASVTLIVEACYAGGMLRPLPRPTRARTFRGTVEVAEGVPVPAPLRELVARSPTLPTPGNSGVVVVSATSESRKSWEDPKSALGYFTNELCRVLLRGRKSPMPWEQIIDEVRLGVQLRRGSGDQWPGLVAPPGRVPFGFETIEFTGSTVLDAGKGQLWMLGGRLQGFGHGDRIEVLDQEGHPLDRGTVEEADLDLCRVTLDGGEVPPGGYHHALLVQSAWTMPVALQTEEHQDRIRAALVTSKWVHQLDDDDGDGREPDVSVVSRAGHLVVAGPGIERIAGGKRASDRQVTSVVEDVEELARARWLREVVAELGEPPAPLECWVDVRRGQDSRRLRQDGDTIHLELDRINCGLRNHGDITGATVFVHILVVNPSGAIEMIRDNVYAPGGFNLFSEIPALALGQERSVALEWREDVPRVPMPMELWFLLTSRPVDMRALTMPRTHARGIEPRDDGRQQLCWRLRENPSYLCRFRFTADPRATQTSRAAARLPCPPAAPAVSDAGPRRRALLLGACTSDLAGVDGDVALMAEALHQHGFDDADIIRVLPATCSRIHSALRHLVEISGPDDTVVLYYSGHGVQLRQDRARQTGTIVENNYFRFIAPSDFESSTRDQFRGITNIEISLALAELTTRNVVVIMDCCYAGRLTRTGGRQSWARTARGPGTEPAERAFSLTKELEGHAQAHFERLATAQHLGPERRAPEANPFAVRVSASMAGSPAFEITTPDGRRGGALTIALHGIMSKASPWMTWQELARELRYAAGAWPAEQQPSVEGPYRRYLFLTDERAPQREVEVDDEGEGLVLVGGTLGGLVVGDRYEILTRESDGHGRWRTCVLDTVSIARVEDTVAYLDHQPPVPVGTRSRWARPIHPQRPRFAIECEGLGPGHRNYDLIRARLMSVGSVEPVLVGGVPRFPVVGRIVASDGKIQLHGRGLAFGRPRTFDPDTAPRQCEALVGTISDNVVKLARAQQLIELTRHLPSETATLAPNWDLRWFCVQGADMSELPHAGAHVLRDDAISVNLVNTGATVFINVLYVGPDAGIELLSTAEGMGVEVEGNGGAYLLGQRSGGRVIGRRLPCPSRLVVNDAGPLLASLVIVVSDGQLDLRSWQQDPIEPLRSEDPTDVGPTRIVRRPAWRAGKTRYSIARFDFELHRSVPRIQPG